MSGGTMCASTDLSRATASAHAPWGCAALVAVFSTAVWIAFGIALPTSAKIAVITFLLAIAGWTLSRLDDAVVALLAVLALFLTGTITSASLTASFGSELVWLMIAAFMLAKPLTATGAIQRIVSATISCARTGRQLFYALSGGIFVTAFLLPSTTARAALLWPVFLGLAAALDKNPRVRRALALLFPTVILLSACASLFGAGAHLLAAEFIAKAGGPRVDYAKWLLPGTPFAVVSCAVATETILRLFLNGVERRSPVSLSAAPPQPFDFPQLYVLGVTAAAVLAMISASLHGLGVVPIMFAAVAAATVPRFVSVSLPQAVKAIEWKLILFFAATIAMADALIATGAANAIAAGVLTTLEGAVWRHPISAATLLALVGLLTHLVVISRSARVAVVIPAIGVPVVGLGYDPAGVMFTLAVGTGVCQTLPVSAKAVALYSKLPVATYTPQDLRRLAAWLLPIHVLLLVVFALAIWPQLGIGFVR